MTFTVTVSGGRWVNLNGSHGNHHAHQAGMNRWKECALRTLAALQVRGVHVDAPFRITAVVHRTTNARSDSHNVTPSIKACIDALVSARIIEDDNDSQLVELVTVRGDNRATPAITLTVEHLEES